MAASACSVTTVSPFAIARVANARYLRGESAHGSYRTGRFSLGDADDWAAAADGDGGGHHCGGGVTGIAARQQKMVPFFGKSPNFSFPFPKHGMCVRTTTRGELFVELWEMILCATLLPTTRKEEKLS